MLNAVLVAALIALPMVPVMEAPPRAETIAGTCTTQGTDQVCEFAFDTTGRTGNEPILMTVPTVGKTLATVEVRIMQGSGVCWVYDVIDPETGDLLTWASDPLRGQNTLDHLVLGPARNVTLSFDPVQCEYWYTDNYELLLQRGPPRPPIGTASFEITWRAHPLPEGTVPSRPAATFEDPHVIDDTGDASEPDQDVLAVWLNDDRLGDGVFEARLAVANVTAMSGPRWYDFRFFLHADEAPPGVSEINQLLDDDSQGDDHHFRISVAPDDEGVPKIRRCSAMIAAASSNPGEGTAMINLPAPVCELDVAASIFTVHILESHVGNPPAGELFTGLIARTWCLDGTVCPENFDDVTPAPKYDFALGGPDVWDELNPRIARSEGPAPAAWYTHPFAAENVADSLQVTGAIVAVVTFLVGLVLLRRRRARAQKLLAEIEAVVREHRQDARAGLIALGDLEEIVDARFRDRKITEQEHQIASQRIATAATRLAMRRDLGLDDGRPGDEPIARVRP